MDESFDWGGGNEDGINEEEEKQFEASGKDALILLIDCTKDMFVATGEENAFELSIKCARSVMTNKIISSSKDLVGIVFFGTDSSDNSAGFKHVTIFQDLLQPGAEKIRKIDELLKSGVDEIETQFGHSNDFALSDALWTCSSMFSKSEIKVVSKRILLFTNNDDPHANDAQLRIQAQRRAVDLSDIGIYLDLMHIQKPDQKFDMLKFYKDIVHLPDDALCDHYVDASSKFDELLLRIRSKHHVKRKMASLMLTLVDGLKIGIGLYILVRSTTVPTATKVFSDTHEELKSIRKTYLSTTGEVLFPSDIKKFINYAGKTVTYNQEELKEITQIYEPGLVLLGFKPRKRLKLHHFVKASYFIYPNDDEISGGTSVFAALLTKCLEKDVIGICRFVARSNSMPQIVAMIPQEEKVDDDLKIQLTPPGFHLLVLPYADDIRHLGMNNPVRADQDQIDKARQIVKKLKFNYTPDSFENPVMQTHWRNVEALALDADNIDEVEDLAKPNNEMINRRAKSLIDQFKNSTFPEDYEPNSKKPRTQTTGNKKPAQSTDIDDTEIRQRAANGTLNKLTVPVLKQFCMSIKIKVTGKKKDELIEEINEYIEQHPCK